MRLQRVLSKKTVLAGLCLLSLVTMFLPEGCSRGAGKLLSPVLAPLGDAGMYLTTHIQERIDRLGGRGGPLGEEGIRSLIIAMRQTIRDQHGRIEELRGWRSRLPDEFHCELVDARVVYTESAPLYQRRQLGAGHDRDVRNGDIVTTRQVLHPLDIALPENLAVLGRQYVVGRIIDTAARTAKLQLVIDPGFKMPAVVGLMIGPGGEREIELNIPGAGRKLITVRHDDRKPTAYLLQEVPPIPVIAEGDGKRIVLKHVPAAHRIMPGDVLTSGYDAKLPFGMSIGYVSRAEPEDKTPHFVTVYVEPLADLASLRTVYIVKPLAHGEE